MNTFVPAFSAMLQPNNNRPRGACAAGAFGQILVFSIFWLLLNLSSKQRNQTKHEEDKYLDGSERTTEGLRCDFMISNPVENDVVLFDVRIAHLVATKSTHFSDNAIGAVQAEYNAKYNKYKAIMTYWTDR